MKRRQVLLGAAAAAAAGTIGLGRPRDHGAPYNNYFRALNDELQNNGPMRPCMVIDLDLMDRNLDLVTQSLGRGSKHLRIVEKTLPCHSLIDYIAKRASTNRLMSFHQPFLNIDTDIFPDYDILMGKPLPVQSAELFFRKLNSAFDPARQLQWLFDTPLRLQEYLQMAKGLGTRLRANIEIDVGLHRGGVDNIAMLGEMLDIIAANPQHLEFSGFMGYDAQVGLGGIPHILGTPRELFEKAMAIYQGFVDFARGQYPGLWKDGLTLNTGGSPSYRLHEAEQISTECCVGTAMLKPTHYDIETLTEHVPAAFIATPVLKATGPIKVPAIDGRSKVFSWWDVNQRETYYYEGGYWLAEYEAPRGLQFNKLIGHSANQEVVNGSPAVGLKVGDNVFMRPVIIEGVLLQFGDLVTLRGGKIHDYWPVYHQTG